MSAPITAATTATDTYWSVEKIAGVSSDTNGMAWCTAFACASMLSSSALAATRCARATAALAALDVAACEIAAVLDAHPLLRIRMMNSARWIKPLPILRYLRPTATAHQMASVRVHPIGKWIRLIPKMGTVLVG